MDTIRLVKTLQGQVSQQQQQLLDLQSQLECAKKFDHYQQQQGGSAGHSSSISRSSSESIQLPSVHAAASAAVGILVEEGPESSFHVKVNCKDRRGLLTDITVAIEELQCEIKRAAISTSPAGCVYDLFEVFPKPGASVSDLDLQCRLHTVLYAHRLQQQRQNHARRRCTPPNKGSNQQHNACKSPARATQEQHAGLGEHRRHAQLRACCSCFLAERSSDLHHQACLWRDQRCCHTITTTTTINGKPHVAHAAESVLPVTAAAATADQLPRELRNESASHTRTHKLWHQLWCQMLHAAD